MFESKGKPHKVRSDQWFDLTLANVLPKADEAKKTEDCVDESFLRRFLTPDKPSLFERDTSHVLDCSYCMRRLMLMRQEAETRNQQIRSARQFWEWPLWFGTGSTIRGYKLVLGVASSLIVAAASVAILHAVHRSKGLETPIVATNARVHATIDLFDSGTMRGGTDEVAHISRASLPVAMAHLIITLPQFSDPGQYNILVETDKSGEHIVARADGTAVERSGRLELAVDIDLRNVKPGAYFLSTVRGSDQGVYYYPLELLPATKKGD